MVGRFFKISDGGKSSAACGDNADSFKRRVTAEFGPNRSRAMSDRQPRTSGARHKFHPVVIFAFAVDVGFRIWRFPSLRQGISTASRLMGFR